MLGARFKSTDSLLASLIVVGWLQLCALPAAQTGQTTGSITGTVTDRSGRETLPVASATVTLIGGGRAVSTALTGSDGQFQFDGISSPCNCTVRATKSGFFDAVFGVSGEGSEPKRLVLTAGQGSPRIEISLRPHASLAGHVTTATGRPLPKATVRLITRVTSGGRIYFLAGAAVQTNDLGEFQIDGLSEGTYIVQLPAIQRPSTGGRVQAQPELFYPSAATIGEAEGIELTAGAKRTSIDFEVPTTKTFSISGVVHGQPAALRELSIRLVADGSQVLGTALAVAPLNPSGVFEFVNVPAGPYLIEVTSVVPNLDLPAAMMSASLMPRPLGTSSAGFGSVNARIVAPTARLREWGTTTGRRYHGEIAITLQDRDMVGLVVPTVALASVSGTIQWDNESPVEAATVGEVRLESVDGTPSLGLPRSSVRQAGARATFTIEGVRPGEYLIRAGQDTYVQSVRVSGRDNDSDLLKVDGSDIANVELTLSSQPGTIMGKIDQFAVDPAVVVLAFPADRVEWSRGGWSYDRIKLAQPTADGSFSLNLPAGSFNLVAVRGADASRWRDPEFLQRASQFATRLAVAWGGTQQASIRILPRG